jgi:hypothetical protein
MSKPDHEGDNELLEELLVRWSDDRAVCPNTYLAACMMWTTVATATSSVMSRGGFRSIRTGC